MAERYKQLKDMVNTNDLFQSITISDYFFSKCLLFAKVNLPEEEFRLLSKFIRHHAAATVFPDILIYLHSPVQNCRKILKKEIVSMNKKSPMSICSIYRKHITSYIKQHNIKTIFIDAVNADFLGNEQHLQMVLDALGR